MARLRGHCWGIANYFSRLGNMERLALEQAFSQAAYSSSVYSNVNQGRPELGDRRTPSKAALGPIQVFRAHPAELLSAAGIPAPGAS
jgi:hypothetical protein